MSGKTFLRYALINACCIAVLALSASATVTFEWATVGNPGNAAGTAFFGFGAVAYEYRIAKYEVTNTQYVEFLNAVAASDPYDLYYVFMDTDPRGGITRSGSSGSYTYATKPNMANKPVNYVSFFDAMRFVNWLHNGQGDSSTETGVYSIADGLTETRDPNATYFLPSEDEWYKAAYHQPASQGGDSDDYWLYPTRSNSTPTVATANSVGDISNPGPNVANYLGGAAWNITDEYGNVTTVGSAGPDSTSFYGTFDQGGNVSEWNEAVIDTPSGLFRGTHGGNFYSIDILLGTGTRASSPPWAAGFITGIRVASPVPEPATLAVLGLGVPVLLRRRPR